MAPEILRGETYTRAADVYSFGVILWELCTGEIPHKGRSLPQIVGSVGYNTHKLKLPPLQQMNKKNMPISAHQNRLFRTIIKLCTQHEAEERPTFEHVLNYLDHVELEMNKA